MKIEVKVPSVGESVNEVTLASWFKKTGDTVQMDEPLCEFESDKATFELPAEAAGTIEIVAQEGSDLKIGDLVCYINTDGAAPAKKEEPKAEEPKEKPAPAPAPEVKQPEPKKQPAAAKEAEPAAPAKESYAEKHPSPAAAKILDEKGVAASDVKGTGRDGRITKDDAQKAEKPAQKAAQPASYERPAQNFSRGERTEKMSRLRRTISKRLVAAKNETAMLTTFNEVNMSRIMQVRDKYGDKFKETHEIGLGFMSFFIKACAIALQKFPAINAYIEEENIIFHDYVDISIAVSTPRGLVVPVIRNAESLSFAEIEKEVKRLATLGRDDKLSMDDMAGGTFTVSNGGVFGSLLSTPIINQPQSAILGMHKIEERPIAVNGRVEIQPMMYVAMSYDHRIVDGKESVGFLVMVKEMLESPEKMLYGDDPLKALLAI